MIRTLLLLCGLLSSTFIHAEKKVINVYAWGGEIPDTLIHQFEKETGIEVNFSTYDSNETMYAKLRASKYTVYDVIQPSAYFVERMVKQGMLLKLDQTQLPNIQNLAPLFADNDYDHGNQYSVPLVWGATGIVYNQRWIKNPPLAWNNLWDKQWRSQLMMLDDSRDVFSIALMSLGYSPNDRDPKHIQEAYEKLLALVPNIKLFSSDATKAIIIDEDVTLGTFWNGDAVKAHAENKEVQFIYPKDGFVIWVDCLAISKNSPHPKEAYQFINFLLNASNAAQIALSQGYAITNEAGRQLLPSSIRDNPTAYPSTEILKRSHFQRDVGEQAIALYNEYWERLKLAF